MTRRAGDHGFIGFLMSRNPRWHGRMMTHRFEAGNARIQLTRGSPLPQEAEPRPLRHPGSRPITLINDAEHIDAQDVDAKRHRRKANYAFVDGHSQLLPLTQTHAPTNLDLCNPLR